MGLTTHPVTRLISKIIIPIAALACLNVPAHADLIGLRVFREGLYGNATPVDGPLWIYRVYAEFTQPSDRVWAWGLGSGQLGHGYIRNISITGQPGSGFNNVPDDSTGNLAPYHPLSARDWDTYMTIGLLYGSLGPSSDDGTGFFGGTPTFIQHGSTIWTGTNAGVNINPFTTNQGRADFMSVIGNDTNTRVLLMQLVVNAGEHVEGSIGVAWISSNLIVTQALPFTSIPHPGAVGLFIGASLWRSSGRRRRR